MVFRERRPDLPWIAVVLLCVVPLEALRQGALRVVTSPSAQALVNLLYLAALLIAFALVLMRMRRVEERAEARAVARERDRVGREIHDGLAQTLAYVNAKAQAVEELLKRGRPREARVQLGQLARATRAALADAREAVLAVRSSPDERESLERTLRRYFESWLEQSGLRGDMRITADLRLAPSQELQLVRIVQEALSNARKHAAARSVAVAIVRHAEIVLAEVRDDGVGFDPGTMPRGDAPRFGLAIMRERAESVGGKLQVRSRPGRGTVVSLRLPARALPRMGGSACAS